MAIEVEDNILKSVKRALSIEPDVEVFDQELLIHINSVFSTLHQLGVGPKSKAFVIETGDEKWDEFFGDKKNIYSAKTFMSQSVRLIFDPPPTSFGIEAVKVNLKEFEWRLKEAAEEEDRNS